MKYILALLVTLAMMLAVGCAHVPRNLEAEVASERCNSSYSKVLGTYGNLLYAHIFQCSAQRDVEYACPERAADYRDCSKKNCEQIADCEKICSQKRECYGFKGKQEEEELWHFLCQKYKISCK